MSDNSIVIISGDEVRELLSDREHELIHVVQSAYEIHATGDISLPHSSFLRFPANEKNRIIALPAYLGGNFDVAGIKWISSFPDNINRGIDRASATIILNSLLTGRPRAIIEGSVISAQRTAASAALAAQYLHCEKEPVSAGLVGCGLINYEITRFIHKVFPQLKELLIFDLNPDRAKSFQQKYQKGATGLEIQVASRLDTIFHRSSLVSFATTASQPYVNKLPAEAVTRTILHVSLRDLAPEVILASDNIVDDPDHVCRAQTSLHLAQQQTGDRKFIRCSLGDILKSKYPARLHTESTVVFSPFGLGILDLAVAKLVYDLALKEGYGKTIDSFAPTPWND